MRDTLSARGTLDLTRSLAEIGWTMENESQVFHIREQAEKGRLQGGAVRPGSVVRDPRRRSSGPRERIPPAAKADGEGAENCRAIALRAIELMEKAPIIAPGQMPVNVEA
ncbi:hypothetical protein ACRAWD_22235 [Caulobacter segnis]